MLRPPFEPMNFLNRDNLAGFNHLVRNSDKDKLSLFKTYKLDVYFKTPEDVLQYLRDEHTFLGHKYYQKILFYDTRITYRLLEVGGDSCMSLHSDWSWDERRKLSDLQKESQYILDKLRNGFSSDSFSCYLDEKRIIAFLQEYKNAPKKFGLPQNEEVLSAVPSTPQEDRAKLVPDVLAVSATPASSVVHDCKQTVPVPKKPKNSSYHKVRDVVASLFQMATDVSKEESAQTMSHGENFIQKKASNTK